MENPPLSLTPELCACYVYCVPQKGTITWTDLKHTRPKRIGLVTINSEPFLPRNEDLIFLAPC